MERLSRRPRRTRPAGAGADDYRVIKLDGLVANAAAKGASELAKRKNLDLVFFETCEGAKPHGHARLRRRSAFRNHHVAAPKWSEVVRRGQHGVRGVWAAVSVESGYRLANAREGRSAREGRRGAVGLADRRH